MNFFDVQSPNYFERHAGHTGCRAAHARPARLPIRSHEGNDKINRSGENSETSRRRTVEFVELKARILYFLCGIDRYIIRERAVGK